jgi:hypothetical protein
MPGPLRALQTGFNQLLSDRYLFASPLVLEQDAFELIHPVSYRAMVARWQNEPIRHQGLELRRKLRPGIRRGYISDTDCVDSGPRRGDPEQGRGLATFRTALELLLSPSR